MNALAKLLLRCGSAVVAVATTGSDLAEASRPNNGPLVAPGLWAE